MSHFIYWDNNMELKNENKISYTNSSKILIHILLDSTYNLTF
jgi:hypothetical protein